MTPAKIQKNAVNPPKSFNSESIFRIIALDSLSRLRHVSSNISTRLLCGLSLLSGAAAQENDPINGVNSSTVAQDVLPMQELVFHFDQWRQNADRVRRGADRSQCLRNLHAVLATIGPLRAAENAGSSGALTLLPTAGALIGTPTKELWVVYKLMPLAGVLSMLLSLGGTMIPSHASEYEVKASGFSYGGLMATTKEDEKEDYSDAQLDDRTEPEKFAARVEHRSKDLRGGLIPWWCTNAQWMLFWYIMVAISSIVENIAGVPFTNQWTLRISRAPKVRISEDAPSVRFLERSRQQGAYPSRSTSFSGPPTYPGTQHVQEDFLSAKPLPRRSTDVLDALEVGFNCKGQIIMDSNEPWSASRVPFYVIISMEGISSAHAVLRVLSKAFSVSCFAAGTLIFASAQFVTISVSLTVLCVVLSAGVFGRVVAMWMASEMIRTRPILHRVVTSRAEAGDYIDHIMAIEGLTVEVLGHVIVNGRCIQRYNKWTRLSTWLGILAEPYDVTKLAVSL
ncbi:MAG: hypothetical protein Q9190_005589 [Brigantiaea leucoxantha]